MKDLIKKILFITTIACAFSNVFAIESSQKELNKLVQNYYKAVENKDIKSITNLLAFKDEKTQKELLLQYKTTFATMDMQFPSVEITGIEYSSDKASAIISTSIESTVAFSDGTTEKPKGKSTFIILARKEKNNWKIVKIMRASTYIIERNTAIQSKALSKITKIN